LPLVTCSDVCYGVKRAMPSARISPLAEFWRALEVCSDVFSLTAETDLIAFFLQFM